jgi:SAM-dependent methyltransferase
MTLPSLTGHGNGGDGVGTSAGPGLTERDVAAVAAIAREHFGGHAVEGAALAAEVRRVSKLYNAGRAPITGDPGALRARLCFYFLRDLPKLDRPFAELGRVDALPRRDVLRVLDLGAGVGTSTLALARFVARHRPAARVEVDAVDRDAAALALARRIWSRAEAWGGAPIDARTIAMDLSRLEARRLRPPYDVTLLALVWNELSPGEDEDRAAARHLAWLDGVMPWLAEDGVLVILEPALRRETRVLQRVRDRLARAPGQPYVFAPCVRRGDYPMLARARDWCHERVPLALPETLAALARDAGLREQDLTYSYLTLHMQPRSLRELAREPLWRIVGGPLRSKGKRELLVCGDATAGRARRLDRDASPDNAVFEELTRGDLASITGAEESGDVVRVGAATRVGRVV